MPINNITQTISELPKAGRRGVDVQTQFVIKQEDFQDHLQGTTVTELNTLKNQLNTGIGEINSTATTMNGHATSASSSASTATTKAGEASTSASAALTSRNQANTSATNASNSATKASQWADNNYNVAVETGKYSAKHWSTVAQNATVNKVDKVTSTDNAIVRFDGTTGAVQNSDVVIDDNNNVGIGVTPSAWGSAGNITANTIGSNNIQFLLGANNYYNSGYKYISTGVASQYEQYNGTHYWKTAPSGTAGNPITWTNAMTLDSSGNLTINSGTGGLGYRAGAGGTVTQLTSKDTAVTLNKPTGRIIMSNVALGAGASARFVLNNILADANDVCMVQIVNMIPNDIVNYKLEVSTYSSGGFYITLTNKSGSTLSEAIQIQFTIIKGASA